MGKYGSCLSKFHLILKKLDSVHTIHSAFFYSGIITRSFMFIYSGLNMWKKFIYKVAISEWTGKTKLTVTLRACDIKRVWKIDLILPTNYGSCSFH